jgi:tetrahydromethanopterin S-methyltransferase subunit F
MTRQLTNNEWEEYLSNKAKAVPAPPDRRDCESQCVAVNKALTNVANIQNEVHDIKETNKLIFAKLDEITKSKIDGFWIIIGFMVTAVIQVVLKFMK